MSWISQSPVPNAIREAETGDLNRDIEALVSGIPVTGAELVSLIAQAASELAAETMAPVRLRDLPQILAGQRPVIDEEVSEPTGVQVMTMHNAKGLTADAVMVAAAEHEVLHTRADPLANTEDVRLIYMSATRARNYLYATFAGRRTSPQAYPAGGGRRCLSDVLSRAGLECW